MSPESASSLYPDRPILPLPKRRLRERIAPDIADSIKYPPAPQSSAPLFVYPYNSRDELVPIASDLSTTAASEGIPEPNRDLGTTRLSSAYDESLMSHYRRSLASRPFQQQHSTSSTFIRTTTRPGSGRHSNPQPPSSTTSSADGYDSFENSNNKKKRKIPTAGESLLGGNHALNDPSSFGVPSPPTTGDEGSADFPIASAAPYYQTGGPLSAANPQGISGPGRGRYGRVRNGRSPLRTLSDPNSLWQGRTPADVNQRSGGSYPSPPTENAGIISHAIATAERLPLPQGQENISLLHQQASSKTSPTSTTHFNFTFDSQNPVSWPGSDPAHPGLSTSSHPQSLPLPGTYHDLRGAARARGTQTAMAPNGTAQGVVSGESATHGTPQSRKPRRRGNSLMRIARQRKEETMYKNYYHPPTSEEFWICEFCEYENIFGRRPLALIQRYEMKERQRLHEDQERKRLLDKYKSRSRKGKKASKTSAKNGSTNPDRSQTTSADPNAPHMHQDPNLDAQNEEYEEDEYYEDDIHSPESSTHMPGSFVSSPTTPSAPVNSRPRRPGESIPDSGS